MAASRDVQVHVGITKAVIPFMPSLLHLASVKVAIPLFKELNKKTLQALSEIQKGNSAAFERNTEDNDKLNRAKEILLWIPAHLRQRVMETVHGLRHAAAYWSINHAFYFSDNVGDRFHFRSDGSLDAVKSVQDMVGNAKLDIGKRFFLACAYCLEDTAQALWSQMVESGKLNSLKTYDGGMADFWLKWVEQRPLVPWSPSLIQFLRIWIARFQHFFRRPHTLFPRLSPFLRLVERQDLLHLLDYTSLDDFRFCLYTLTKGEEEELLKKGAAYRILDLHLKWPLQTLFLDTAEKLLNYIDYDCFQKLVFNIFMLKADWDDFSYYEIFEGFWNMSPVSLRERARVSPYLKTKIDSYFDVKRRKEKTIDTKQSS